MNIFKTRTKNFENSATKKGNSTMFEFGGFRNQIESYNCYTGDSIWQVKSFQQIAIFFQTNELTRTQYISKF